jgi:hypothetical protein
MVYLERRRTLLSLPFSFDSAHFQLMLLALPLAPSLVVLRSPLFLVEPAEVPLRRSVQRLVVLRQALLVRRLVRVLVLWRWLTERKRRRRWRRRLLRGGSPV